MSLFLGDAFLNIQGWSDMVSTTYFQMCEKKYYIKREKANMSKGQQLINLSGANMSAHCAIFF